METVTALPPDRLDQFLGRPVRALISLSAPMMIGFTVHAGYAIVDSIYIGRLGSDALAAAGYIGALFFLAIALTNGLATGLTAAVARAVGTRDRERQSDLASGGLALSVLLSLVFGIAGLLFGEQVIPILGARGDSERLAWAYMMPLWLGMPLFFVTTAIRSVLNGEGDARSPMIILVASTLVNLLLDPIFMFVLDYGIAGAAYATLVAQGVALLALLYLAFLRRRMTSRFRWSPGVLRWRILSPIVGIGTPTAAGFLVMAIGGVFINRVVAEFGQAAVAGYVAGTRIDMIVILPVLGLGAGAMTLVGMFSGAGRPDLVRSITLTVWKGAVLSAIGFGVLVLLLSEVLLTLFVREAFALEVGRQYLRYAVWTYPLMAVGMTSSRILQGMGIALPSLIITVFRVLVVGVTGAYVAVYLLNGSIVAVWMSFVVGGVSSVILSMLWVRKYVWGGHVPNSGKSGSL